MGIINRLGTQIRLPDGREATVVFNGLSGVGIKFGLHDPDPKDFRNTHVDVRESEPSVKPWPWEPDAMLRDKYPSAELPCVGDDYEIIREGKI